MAGSTSLSLVARIMTRGLLQSHVQFAGTGLSKRWMCVVQQEAKESTKSSTEDAQASGSSSPISEDAQAAATAQLNKQIEELNSNVAEMKDKYQRALADRENTRGRLEKQVIAAKLYGIQGFCKDLLEVSDVFRKALESVPEDQLKTGGPDQLKTLYDGLTMTETHMLSVLRRHGLSTLPLTIGEKFDPNWHEAMFEVPSSSEGQAPGTVAHVIRTGWKLHDRCIRSAQVGVVKEH